MQCQGWCPAGGEGVRELRGRVRGCGVPHRAAAAEYRLSVLQAGVSEGTEFDCWGCAEVGRGQWWNLSCVGEGMRV